MRMIELLKRCLRSYLGAQRLFVTRAQRAAASADAAAVVNRSPASLLSCRAAI